MKKTDDKMHQEWTKRSKDLYDLRVINGRTTHFGPDISELRIHKKSLEKVIAKNKQLSQETNLLVLGATPELRDLGLACGCNVYCVDANQKVLDAAKKHLIIEDRSREKTHIGDWSNLDMFEDNKFSYIMGSVSINNVPFDMWQQVFDELKRVKKDYGIISLRQIVFPDIKREDYSFKRTLKDYKEGMLSEREFYVILRFNSFLREAYDSKTKTLYAKKVFDKFEELHNKGALSKDEFEYLNQFRNSVEHTVLSQNNTRDTFEKYLGKCKIRCAQGERYFGDVYNIFEMNLGGK
ncbi:MAG: class I SAM-dependent methyltransferase [Nanoarchaeota archaeon]|nr:class I SAM-dependent methyltransferase [Nanoarchaeota archaeon]